MEIIIYVLIVLLFAALASARHYRERAEAWQNCAAIYAARERAREVNERVAEQAAHYGKRTNRT